MISHPHALYYNGELIGLILNPDPHSNISTIVDALSPDEANATAIPIPRTMGNLEPWLDFAKAAIALGVKETIEPEEIDE